MIDACQTSTAVMDVPFPTLKSQLDEHIQANEKKFAEYDSLISSYLKGSPMTDGLNITSADPAMMMAAMNKGDGGMLGGGGLLGGLLLGTLLRGGNLLGGGDNAQSQANMSIMAGLGDLKQAVAVGGAQMETSNANQTIATMSAINASTGATQIAVGGVKDLVNSNGIAMMQMFNTVNQTISADGDKTRALITNQYEATLNRQLSDANAAIIELRGDQRAAAAARATEITVNQNVNQMQQQQQQQVLNDRIGALLAAHQNIQQGIVNLGTMTGQAGQQTAANTRVY